MTRHERPRNNSATSYQSKYSSEGIAPSQTVPQGSRNAVQVPKPRRFERDQSVSPGSHLPSSPPMGSPNASASMMGLGDHRRELSVLQTPSYIRNSPSSGPGLSPAGTSNGFPSATTPVSAVSSNNGSQGILNSNIFDSYQSDHYSQYRPGTAPGLNGSTSSGTIGPDSYFPPDDRRPSVASLATNASSTGSKTSIGRSIVRRIFGDDDKESPGSSDSSLLQNNVLQRPNGSYSRTNTQTSSRPQTPVPSSDVVPFLYQDPDDISKYGEAPVRQQPVMAGMRYDGSEEADQKSSYRSHFKRKKDKVDKDKDLPPPPIKDFAPNKEHRKELAKIDGMSLSQNSSQSRLGERPSSPTPSIASSMSNNIPKSPGPHQQKKSSSFFRHFGKKGKGDDYERAETPQPAKKSQKPEPLQLFNSPHKYEAQTPKRGATGGVDSSIRTEYHNYVHNYIHPRASEYAIIEHQPARKNVASGPQAHGKMKAMKRGYSSNDTSVTRKLGPFGRSKVDEEALFTLDTDLSKLDGIVSARLEMAPESGKFLTAEEPLKTGNMSASTVTAPEHAAWRVPDSWRYVGHAEGGEEIITRGESLENEFDVVETPGQEALRRPSLAYCIRVFRADSTFATLSCSISASVTDVLKLLGRKSFLQDDLGNYQLIIKKGDLSRILQPHERPLQIQKRLLEQAGYTQYDHLEEIGREDHSYLCRFTFRMITTGGCSLEADPGLSKMQKFNHVELQGKNLFTIPILLYQKAAEIIALNLSYNLSVDIPTDFIQACINLRKIEFQGNEATKLPPSISYASRLTYLDISNNRLESLDSAELHKASALVSLKMTNNQLTSLPSKFAEFKNLRSLHISSNSLTTFPQFICSLATLVDLDVSFNAIPNFPDEIGQLSALERLIATNNQLAGSFPPAFAKLTTLKELDVRYNPLTNIDVVADLPRVELVLIGHNSVSGLEKSFQKIRALHLNSNPVTRFSLPGAMPTLTYLNLSSANLTSFGDAVFDKLPNLQKLVLDKNHIAAFPAGIGKLKKLEHLSACYNRLTSLSADIGQLSELKYLDLHSNNIKILPPEIWHLQFLMTLNLSSNILTTFPKPTINPNLSTSGTEVRLLPKISDGEEGSPESDGSRRPSQTSAGLLSVSPSGNGKEGSIVSIYGPGGRKASVMSSKSVTSTDSGVDRPSAAVPTIPTSIRKDSAASNKFANTMAQSLKYLYLADNQLTDDVFDEIQLLSELRVLNLSYNGLYDVPNRALGRMIHLNELYLSGNELTSLPTDDLENLSHLKVLHINGNKFQTLPAELGKVRRLLVLDVGSNSLKYNISNWPYDWNWNWNLELKFLNLSGNRRLEIKPNVPQNSSRERSITDFSQLSNLRVLGLMDVTLTIPQVPDQTEDRRVRTSSSMVRNMSYGMADSLGRSEHLSVIDMVVPDFRGNRDECVFGMFDGQSLSHGGSKVAMFLHEHFTYYFTAELNKIKLRPNENTANALRRTFLSLNKGLANTAMQTLDEKSGPTRGVPTSATILGPDDLHTGSSATVVYLVGNDMFVANVGDAMAILVRSNGDTKILTKKHEPGFGSELERIRDAGGWVSRNGKLNEVLDVSRSFGYFHLMPAVHAAPHIHEVQLSDQDEILIIASKEVWEYINYQTAVDIVWLYKGDLMRAAHRLRDFAIAYGATNKIMVMLIGVGDLKKAKKRGPSVAVPNNFQPEELALKAVPKPTRGASDDVGLNRLTPEITAPEGDVSLVFTDIKNSTLLWETHPIAMRAGISIHNQIMRRWLRIIGGYEVKTEGDAFMVAFPTVTSALHWCFTVQRSLLEAPWPNEILDSEHGKEIYDAEGRLIYRGLSVRMGIHFGQPVCEADPITRRMDYFGPMVNRAARIEGEADGGQICVSSDFITEIRRILSVYLNQPCDASLLFDDPVMAAKALEQITTLSNQGFETKALGERKLKGLENPEFVYLVFPPQLAGRLVAKAAKPKLVAADQLWKLWDLALRLEMVCSVLTSSDRPEPRVLSKEMGVLLRTAGEGLSEAAILPMFEHIVSRIENSMANLAIRKLLSTNGNPFEPGFSILNVLEALEARITPVDE